MLTSSILRQPSAPLAVLGAVLAATLLLYLPGINGPFLFDDNHNFLNNPFVQMARLDLDSVLDAAYSGGGHFPSRGLSRISFALNYYYSGGNFDPRVFKLTNILIHVLNAALIFALSRALFTQYLQRHQQPPSRERVMWMAVLSAGVWALHPMQLTSVLYAVQRMTSLSALFVLLGLLVYVCGRCKVQRGETRGFWLMAIGIGVGSILGVLNKENAALSPFLAFVIHLAFFPASELELQIRRQLRAFHMLFVGSALVLAIAGIAWTWSSTVSSFDFAREFSMLERLLTQPRVLFFYLSLFLFPSLRRLSLHHDDLVVSAGLLSPPSTLLALVALVLLFAYALFRLRSGAIWAFAVVFYLVAQSMESSFLSLEMVYEHRNYLPSFALALLFVHALAQFTRATTRPVLLAALLGVAVVSGVGVVTWARVGIWSNDRSLERYMTEQHPDSYRALALSARAEAATRGTVSDIFSAYARIARAKSTTIFPLIRMRRLVNAMQFQLRESMVVPSTSAPDTALGSRGWDATALYLDAQYLHKIATALDAEIKRRLTQSPMHNETLAEFREVRRCIEARLDLCIGLDAELRDWMQVALEHSRMNADARVRILDQMAWLQEKNADLEGAHASLRQAMGLIPSDSHAALREVLLFARQGQFDEAEQRLRQIEARTGMTRINRRRAAQTRQYLEWVREQEQAARQAPVKPSS